MNRLGTVMHRSKSNRLILLMSVNNDKKKNREKKAENLSGSQAIVVTQNMKQIGKIDEIFGSVDRPFVSVKVFKRITTKELNLLKKQDVYTL